MNYKLVIADDEPLILVGIQSMLDWESLGITVAGVARNGEQLLELIASAAPDIVITDIRMPVKSGLEVMKECSELYGRLPLFIVLTSHEEYGYVKEAISFQAVNYLVKIELTKEILADAVARSVAILRDIKRLEPAAVGDRAEMQPFIDKFFVRLLNGLFETREQYLQQREDLALELDAAGYLAGYCSVGGIDASRMDKDKLVSLYSSTVGMVRETVSQHMPCFVVSLDMRHFCIIFRPEESQDSKARQQIIESLSHSVTLVRNYFAVSLRCSVGEKVLDLFLIQQSFATARRIHSRQGIGDAVLLFDAQEHEAASEPGFDMASWRDDLGRAFLELDFAALADVLDRIVAKLAAADAPHVQAMDAACSILYMALSQLPDGEEIVSGIFEGEKDGYRSIYEYKTAEKCREWIAALRDGLVEVLQTRKQDYRLRVVTKVQRYIADNIGKRLSLSEVASIHGFSQNYLSSLFSRYGGCSFVEYTTRAKIAAAKQLMSGGRFKIHEIADQLGFESAFYFSKVFKKIEGISPREYMQQGD